MNDTKETIDKEYSWDGDWEGPKAGMYYIMENNREMEPGELIDCLNHLQDFLVQKQELQELRQFKVKVITALYSAQYSWEELWCELTEGNLE